MKPYCLLFNSPLGELTLLANENCLTHLYLPEHKGAVVPEVQSGEGHSVLLQVKQQLEEYFAGERTSFDVPLFLKGTVFQQQVWDALQTIPFGETWTYSGLAHTLGKERAVRAVGTANGRNPISIIVPCHRVIGANGSLTGYAGGVERKKWLLSHEQSTLRDGGEPTFTSEGQQRMF